MTDLAALFAQNANMVYRLALSCLGSVHDAEDITQTVFLKALNSLPEGKPEQQRAWLCRVTVNACRDLQRSFWRRNTLPPEARCRILRDLTAAKPPRRRPVSHAALIAAVLVLALGMTAGAVTLASFFSGGVNDGGLDAAELKILVRGENGRVLLTTPDGEIDVTELCSESEPYLYEFTDEAGVVHIIACGGTAEDCGFAEFLCDGQTGAIDAQGWVGTGGRPAWLTRAEQLLGLRE